MQEKDPETAVAQVLKGGCSSGSPGGKREKEGRPFYLYI